ncbi:hypothetical protein Pelo_6522 [Pelomyxa schiedti]|nr:hypothetical protein Pelo_6522 [Pelomyxa schiedti]
MRAIRTIAGAVAVVAADRLRDAASRAKSFLCLRGDGKKEQFMDCARKLEELIRLKCSETDDVPNYHPPFTSAQQISSCDTTSSGMDGEPIKDSDQYD